MRQFLLAGVIAACATVGVRAAHAAVFDFTYDSTSSFAGPGTGDQTIKGTFTTGAANPGGSSSTPSLAITEISGTYNGQLITGLLPAGTYYKTSGIFGSPGNDNILYYPSTLTYLGQPTYIDYSGVSFSTASDYVNLYFGLGGSGDTYGTSLTGGATSTLGILTVTPAGTAVPEPGSLALLGVGLLGLALAGRRKQLSVLRAA